MNYRHAYHAGNFADVLKHLVLVHVISYLARKEKGFRVVDTHGGIGVYDLGGMEAGKTGEWQQGIGRLIDGSTADHETLRRDPSVATYLDAVLAFNPLPVSGAARPELGSYPGSPALARHLLRPQDALLVNELHPDDYIELKAHFARDRQTTVLNLDGWLVVKSALPPKERRGVVLIDPPFEVAGEFGRMVKALSEGARRFATGVYVLWYPIKDVAAVRRFKRDLTALGLGSTIAVELSTHTASGKDSTGLAGTGLIVHNPPFGLAEWLEGLLPSLCAVLARGPGGAWTLENLDGA